MFDTTYLTHCSGFRSLFDCFFLSVVASVLAIHFHADGGLVSAAGATATNPSGNNNGGEEPARAIDGLTRTWVSFINK